MKHKEATCKLQDHLLAANSIKLVLLCSQFCVWHLRPALALKAVMRSVCCALVSTPAHHLSLSHGLPHLSSIVLSQVTYS